MRRLIVAAGETSGAVTTALGIRTVLVADEADPGVPWTYATTPSGDLALMLKSGNFGAQTCFSAASGRPSSAPVRRRIGGPHSPRKHRPLPCSPAGLTHGSPGNLAVRLSDGSLLLKPRHSHRGRPPPNRHTRHPT
ncbi:nucleotide-binding domain containing protein [Streptomyces scopuliridis]|uniref:nucleotide-binding domain containing protein n=1 Tax=Streptomyces scopuliridis TaxID=452529 RepID=UPI0036D20260